MPLIDIRKNKRYSGGRYIVTLIGGIPMFPPPLLACILCRLFSPSGETSPEEKKPKGSKFLPAVGEKSTKTLFLFHGFGTYAFAHKHSIQAFRKAGFNIVVAHLLGHGSKTGKLTHIILNYGELVNQALSVFRYYNERCAKGHAVAFVGMSTGAIVLLLAAIALRKDASIKSRLRCFIGIGTAFNVTHNETRWYVRKAAHAIRHLLRIPFIGPWLAQYTLPRHFSVHEISDDKIVQDYLLYNPKICKDTLPIGWASSIDTMGKLAFKKLGKLDIPVLLLHGNQDTIAQCPTLDPGKHKNTTLVIRPGKHDVISGPDPGSVPVELLSRIPDYKPSANDAESRKMIIEFLNKHMS